MPVFNREEFLHKSIESVLKQTYKNFELICVNDGSTDNSEKIINEFASKDSRVRYIYQKNKGRCIARNTGVLHSAGKWICFLDSDDTYFENHLETFSNLIKSHPEQNAFATEQLVAGNKKKYFHKKLYNNLYTVTFQDNIYSNPISPNQLCYNYNATQVLFADENIPISEDWLFIRSLTLQTSILKSNTVTNNVTEHAARTVKSADAEEMAMWNLYSAEYLIRTHTLSTQVVSRILSRTLLLCANILLSKREKKKAWPYFSRSLKTLQTYRETLFYKALIKFII